jgi:hypothetical protein
MTSTSPVDIANRALALAGARSIIADFNENTPSANAVRLWYDADRLYMLRGHRWNFARFQGPLTLLATAPGVDAEPATNLPWPFMPWSFAYAYPDNCAKFNYILPTFNGPQVQVATAWQGGPQPIIPFVVSSYNNPSDQPVEAIYTNQVAAYGTWTRDITSPALFDAMFSEAFSLRLAASVTMQLNGLTPLVAQLRAAAEALAEQANAQDGNEGTHTMNTIPEWIRARGYASDWIGPGYGYGAGGNGFGWYGGWGGWGI